MLNVTVLTVFPELFPGFLGYSLTGKALEEQKWQLQAVNIRDYAFDRHKSVDDTPCGGGAGMIMRPDVLGRAIEANHTRGRIIYMSPKGRPLTQKLVHELSREEELTIVCGRFEGIDERVIDAYNGEEISIGDYILTGGEQAAQIMLRCVQPDAGLPAQPVHFFRTVRAGPYAAQHRIADGAPTRIKQLPYPAQCPARGAVIAHQSFFTATITRTRLPAAQPKLSYQPVR